MAQFVEERFEIFESQDKVKGLFDVTFEFDGKSIYAHKFMLGSISTVFNTMISETWNNGEPIKIQTHSFNDFKEFLTFIYSGNCKITDENIFVLVDLSEFYNVKALQQKCDEYLAQKEYTKENILVFFEALTKYSLPLFEKAISTAMAENGINLIEAEGFLKTSKEILLKILSFENRFVSEETLFEKVFEWSENQATMKNVEKLNNENFNKNDAIKSEITEFLPLIQFKKMNLGFLLKFVVKKGFLFSYDELSEISDFVYSFIKVKITNSNGKSISCLLPPDSNAYENIKSLKQTPCFLHPPRIAYWETIFAVPSTPSLLKIRDGVEWYLIYFNDGKLAVIHHSLIFPSYYLIAEMTAETSGFVFTGKNKVEIE